MAMLKYIRTEGERMPPWYYGLAYNRYQEADELYYIMPLNYLIRWKRYIHHHWIRKVQRRESWFDKQVKQVKQIKEMEKNK